MLSRRLVRVPVTPTTPLGQPSEVPRDLFLHSYVPFQQDKERGCDCGQPCDCQKREVENT